MSPLATVRLGDHVDLISSGSTPLGGAQVYLDAGPVLFVRSQNVRMNELDLREPAYISEEIHRAMRRTEVKYGDVLLNITGASIGRVAVFNVSNQRANVNQHVCLIRTRRTSIEPTYLSRVNSSPAFQSMIRRVEAGGTRQALTFSQIADFKIPAPPLTEQRRIAAILDQADAVRAKRREAIASLDILSHSIFLDMFGDPAVNPKRWPERPMSALAERFSDGPFGSNLKTSQYRENGVRVVRLQNIGIGEFIDSDRAYISEQHFSQLARHECLPGDVLIATLGDPNLRACILPTSMLKALNKADCVQIRTRRDIATPEYICAVLNSPSIEKKAQALVLGQTRLRISMGRLRTLHVPVPDISLQREFATRIAAVRSLKHSHSLSLAKLYALLASLQYRAFRGEL